MKQLEVLRNIQRLVGGDGFVKLEIGNRNIQQSNELLGPTQSRIRVFLEKSVSTFVIDDAEWQDPIALVNKVVGVCRAPAWAEVDGR